MSKETRGLAAEIRRDNGHPSDTAGIAAGSIVLTLDGALPVEHLVPGDRIITRDGMRVLRAVEVRVARNQLAIRIAARALGHDRPEGDMHVAPSQGILIRDWRAKALYGVERAMVPAERLIDGDYIRAETCAELRLFTLAFDRAAVIYVNGLELAAEPEPVTA